MNNADERMREARVWLRHHCIVPEFEGEMADGKRKFKRWLIPRETLAIPVAQQVMAKLGGRDECHRHRHHRPDGAHPDYALRRLCHRQAGP